MVHTSKYFKLNSKIELLKEKKQFKNEIFELDKSILNEKKNKKIDKYISKENTRLYQFEFPLLDIDEEVKKRLPSLMKNFNIKDYWKRREAIQKWRVANYSLKATEIFYATIEELNLKKERKEKEVRENIYKKLSYYIASNENKNLFVKRYEDEKLASNQRIEKYKNKVETYYLNKLTKLEKTNKKAVNKIDKKIEVFIAKKSNMKDESYSLPEGIVLRVENLTMQFGGLKAVDDLSFDVKKGEIFGLIGPNGAGKTTVFNCITQFYKPTKGNLYFLEKSGNTVSLNNYVVHNVIKKGIVRTFQNVELVKEVSVLDNLLIAAHTQYKSNLVDQFLHFPILKKEEKAIRAKAEEVLEFMGLSLYKDWLAWGLPYGILKKIEIARTLMNNPQLIILDEPAAGLNDTETAELTKLIRKIQEKYECTILLVEHDMGLVMDICDTVCAISFGKLLAIGTTEEIQANKDVQAAYLGYAEEE